jgi:hypothetical protein
VPSRKSASPSSRLNDCFIIDSGSTGDTAYRSLVVTRLRFSAILPGRHGLGLQRYEESIQACGRLASSPGDHADRLVQHGGVTRSLLLDPHGKLLTGLLLKLDILDRQ